MLLILIDILINVRIHKRNVIQPAQSQYGDIRAHHHRNLQLQMLILILTRISIFLITTLPIAIYRITSPRDANLFTSVLQITTIWTGLGWFQSLNYAVSIPLVYYLHFLTLYVGKLL